MLHLPKSWAVTQQIVVDYDGIVMGHIEIILNVFSTLKSEAPR